MTIELLVAVAGRDFSLPPGTHSVADDVGEMLIKAGHAKKAADKKPKKDEKE